LLEDAARVAGLSDDGCSRVESFKQAIGPFLQPNLVRSLRDQVELAWCALGGPALLIDSDQLENIYRFLASVSRLETGGTLDDVRELEQWLDAERVSSEPDVNCRLNIMTMHKAKGLQFAHVILPGLGRISRGNEREMLNWLTVPDASGRSEMIISPVGPRKEMDNDPLHQFIESMDREKTIMELDRLLYVACTRAQSSLHLIGSVNVSADADEFRPADKRSLLRRLWPALEPEFAKAFTNWQSTREDAEGPTERISLKVPVLRRLAEAWQMPDIGEIAGSPAIESDSGTREEKEVEFYWVGAAARHAGTIVHRWFQILVDSQPDLSSVDHSAIRTVSERWARQMHVPEAEIGSVCDRVMDAIHGTIGGEKGRWILQGQGSAELSVTGVVEGRVESVVIDRIKIDDDGTHWIIDYKTSNHEGGDLPGFLQQEEDRYRPQLEKYATLYTSLADVEPKAALYFPLLNEFQEVRLSTKSTSH
jgi:ATP-dependent exoDNAse (exonuclease V) beta subunit